MKQIIKDPKHLHTIYTINEKGERVVLCTYYNGPLYEKATDCPRCSDGGLEKTWEYIYPAHLATKTKYIKKILF